MLLDQAKLPDGHGELYVLLALAAIVVLIVLFLLVHRAHATAVRAEEERVQRAADEQLSR